MTQEQFTQTYLPFSGKMYALAYNLLRNRDEARDCVQDVFAELWQRRADIGQDKPPLPLLHGMSVLTVRKFGLRHVSHNSGKRYSVIQRHGTHL